MHSEVWLEFALLEVLSVLLKAVLSVLQLGSFTVLDVRLALVVAADNALGGIKTPAGKKPNISLDVLGPVLFAALDPVAHERHVVWLEGGPVIIWVVYRKTPLLIGHTIGKITEQKIKK